jgi:hypothetical protein
LITGEGEGADERGRAFSGRAGAREKGQARLTGGAGLSGRGPDPPYTRGGRRDFSFFLFLFLFYFLFVNPFFFFKQIFI